MKKDVVFCKDCEWSNATWLRSEGVPPVSGCVRKCYCTLLDRWMWNRGFCSLGAKRLGGKK